MSEHTVAKKRSRRAPSNSVETVAESTEDVVSEPTGSPVEQQPVSIFAGPWTPARRMALGAVAFFGILILLAIAILIIGLAKGWERPAAAPAPAKPSPTKGAVSMSLQPGYHILSSDTQPGRLILHVRSDTSDEIWVIDTNDGRIVAVIHGEAPKQ